MRSIAYVLTLALLSTPATAHEWFSSKKTSSGSSCCNKVDCVEIEETDWWQEGNAYVVRWRDGLLYYIPAEQAQPSESKEGKAAACVWNGRLRCFFLPVAY